MNGGHFRDLFEAALDGTLGAADRERLDAHLAGCAACREEIEFARRLRKRAARTAPGLSAAEMFRIRSGIADRIEGRAAAAGPRRLIPVPVLAAGLAVSVLALWFASRLRGPLSWERPEPALELKLGPAAPELRRGQFEALGGLGGTAVAARPEVEVLFDFETFPELQRATIVGFAPPELAAPGYSGRRALRLARGGDAAAPAEIRMRLAAGMSPSAVTAWVRCGRAPATVKLAAELASGAVSEAAPARRVLPGEWRWVAFSLDRAAVERGGGIVELRISIECAGPVELDRVEAWKGRLK